MSRSGRCLFIRNDDDDDDDDDDDGTDGSGSGSGTTWVGVWASPQPVRCRTVVARSALQDPTLPGFVVIKGDGDRELGLSWGLVQVEGRGHPGGYMKFVLKTQMTYGYLGIGFGVLPILMIPGDGVWGWMDGSGDGEVVAYRMVRACVRA
jgi:hypothetical protein